MRFGVMDTHSSSECEVTADLMFRGALLFAVGSKQGLHTGWIAGLPSGD